MQYRGLNELREMYLSFFESKQHLRLPSFSLIPQNDASLFAHQFWYGTDEAFLYRRAGATAPSCDNLPKVYSHRRY